MNIGNEFTSYYTKHLGKGSLDLHYFNQQIESSMTPYILEEREMRATQIDIFSRLMRDRIIWVAGGVDDRMSTVVQAQLMFLDNLEVKDVTLHVDTPGGSVKSGLSIVDVMNYVSSDIVTVNTGMAASMGSILLGAGTKGKRFTLPNSRVMLHQVSTGASGNIQDIRRSIAEGEKYNDKLFSMLGDFTNKTPEQVLKDAERDFWMDGEEALAYGIVDGIITNKKKK